MHNTERAAIADSVYAAIFTGLITVGAYITFPLPFSPVPIVLQNFFVLLAGLLLPLRWSLAAVALYLGLGAVGLPVFSAARGGLAHFAGPTGGYLVGFLPAVMVCGLIGSNARRAAEDASPAAGSIVRDAAAAVAATLVIYAVGTPWLASVAGLDASGALAGGVLPFLPGDAIKIVAAVGVARATRPLITSYRSGRTPASPDDTAQ
ncbi:MAG: biotin transporter BioY [Spirochaetota bacterium]